MVNVEEVFIIEGNQAGILPYFEDWFWFWMKIGPGGMGFLVFGKPGGCKQVVFRAFYGICRFWSRVTT
jgi:hypothetical protein